MSLINDMLKDLERRPHAQAVDSSDILAGLKWTVSHEWKSNKNYYVIIGGLLLVLLLASSYLLLGKRVSLQASIPSGSQKNTNSHAALVDPARNDALLKPTSQPAVLTGIALQVQQNSTALRFLLNQNTFYRVSHDISRNEFIIIFDKTHLLAALPKMNYLGSGVENIRAYADEKGNLKLVLQLADDVDVKRLDLNEEGKAPELQLDLSFKNNPTPVTATNNPQKTPTIPVIIKKPVAENTAEQQYQQALSLMDNGQTQDAMHLLAGVINAFPQYNMAREKLASLYLDSNNLTAAKYLVNVGIKRQADYLPFTELKAHILMRENNLEGAIATLETAAPPLTKNPEYHAFIAALYQRAGKAKLAANLYKQLLALQPMNGKWWLGFGVALDAIGQHEQALEAFANASNAGNLSPELKAYVSTQLHNA